LLIGLWGIFLFYAIKKTKKLLVLAKHLPACQPLYRFWAARADESGCCFGTFIASLDRLGVLFLLVGHM
jgi:hypothetical protein